MLIANNNSDVTLLQQLYGEWHQQKQWIREPILVGSTVRVNAAAENWATGEAIHGWVHDQTFIVHQVRNNNSEYLLEGPGGVNSWIHLDDITLD